MTKEELKEKILEGRTEREKLELAVHFALMDLSNHFKSLDDPLQYEVNRLWHKFDHLRNIPNFPMAKKEILGE